MLRFALRLAVSEIQHVQVGENRNEKSPNDPKLNLKTMLNVPKKNKKKKMPKIQNWKFHISLSNFGRPSPRVCMIFGSEPGAYFQRRCRLKFLLPYGSIC